MKRGTFKRKPISEQKPMKRTPLARRSTRKPKTSARQKKMAIKRELILTYDLPNLECKRYGTTKGATRTDILKGMLWNVFARWVRRRDQGRCISCGLPKTYEQLQAGHFAPAGGQNLDLCFDPCNVNGECEFCNAFDSWHLIPMRVNLIEKYGEAVVAELERQKEMKLSSKWEEIKFVGLIKYYYEELKQYEKN